MPNRSARGSAPHARACHRERPDLVSADAGPVTDMPRSWRRRAILRAAVPAALIAAVFGLALPHIASYRAVWASIDAMTWPSALLVVTAAAASMVTYWITIRAVLPRIRLRQAAAVSLGSNAVASTLPAGGAVAMGVSWAMLSSWGLSTADYVLYTLVTGIWNAFTLMGLPFLAVLIMATASRPDATMITGAAVGLALLVAMPVTPGGLGITELGLIGILADGAGHEASAQVTAAVLMYRAVTYLPSIPLGALACLTWRYAPALISTSPRRLPGQARISMTSPAGAMPSSNPSAASARSPAHHTIDMAV